EYPNGAPGRSDYHAHANTTTPLVDTPYFQTNYLPLMQGIEKDFTGLDSFVVYMCAKGAAVIKADGKTVEIKQGELVLIPAMCEIVDIYPDTLGCELLETYMGE
ncbi:MAG: mannose-6-phosphate isomerase, partial [Bacteroidales bacterium]|nr:mannose-6-phosphate isomerase [Bacteroidales bacterium]